jgi:MFS family permease
VLSFYGLGRVIGGLVGGRLSDKLPPAMISVVSLGLQASGFLLLIKLHNYAYLIINMFILGLATYAFTTSNNIWILEQCKGNEKMRLKVLGILHASSNLGIGLSALYISLLAGFGYPRIFLISSILLLMCAGYFVYLTKKGVTRNMIKAEVTAPINNAHHAKNPNQKIINIVLICLFLTGLIIAQLGSTYPIYIHSSFPGLGVHAVSLLFGISSILIVMFQVPFVNYVSRFNKLTVVGIGAFLIGIGMLMLSIAFYYWVAILACIIYTVGEMMFIATAQSA